MLSTFLVYDEYHDRGTGAGNIPIPYTQVTVDAMNRSLLDGRKACWERCGVTSGKIKSPYRVCSDEGGVDIAVSVPLLGVCVAAGIDLGRLHARHEWLIAGAGIRENLGRYRSRRRMGNLSDRIPRGSM